MHFIEQALIGNQIVYPDQQFFRQNWFWQKIIDASPIKRDAPLVVVLVGYRKNWDKSAAILVGTYASDQIIALH
jgi:hypothetical protein